MPIGASVDRGRACRSRPGTSSRQRCSRGGPLGDSSGGPSCGWSRSPPGFFRAAVRARAARTAPWSTELVSCGCRSLSVRRMNVSRAASCAFASSISGSGGEGGRREPPWRRPPWPPRVAREPGRRAAAPRLAEAAAPGCSSVAFWRFTVLLRFRGRRLGPASGRGGGFWSREARASGPAGAATQVSPSGGVPRRRTPGPGRPGAPARPPGRGRRAITVADRGGAAGAAGRLRQRPLDVAFEPPPRRLGLSSFSFSRPTRSDASRYTSCDRVEPVVVDQREPRGDRRGGEGNADVDRLDRVAERQPGHHEERAAAPRRPGARSTATRSARPRGCPRRSGRSRRSPRPGAARRCAGGCARDRSVRRCPRRSIV